MNSLLYYPYINLPQNNWTIRALLYYDNVNSIVPEQYFNEPERYSPFMRKAIQQELITPINPMYILDNPHEISIKFIEYLSAKNDVIERRRRFFSNQVHKIHRQCKLHANKFDNEIFAYLMEIGLAERIDYCWYNVENKTADDLMFLLSSVIADKIQSIVATDKIDYSFSQIYAQNNDAELRNRQYKRDLILRNLIPYPIQIDLANLRRFKENITNSLLPLETKLNQSCWIKQFL
ncbi:MAG: hypothetical protein NC115_07765 [Bacteroidales bacterium]|nr:hypothetical protein [Bacteroidales bacterium]